MNGATFEIFVGDVLTEQRGFARFGPGGGWKALQAFCLAAWGPGHGMAPGHLWALVHGDPGRIGAGEARLARLLDSANTLSTEEWGRTESCRIGSPPPEQFLFGEAYVVFFEDKNGDAVGSAQCWSYGGGESRVVLWHEVDACWVGVVSTDPEGSGQSGWQQRLGWLEEAANDRLGDIDESRFPATTRAVY